MDLNALWAQIQATEACGPYIHTAEMPKISSQEAYAKDAAVAAILSVGRTRLHPRLVSERGVLEALGPVEGDAVLTALESITSPDALPEAARPYYGAIRRGVAWLKGDGLDVGSPTTRQMLDLLAAVGLIGAASVTTLKALGEVPDPISADHVSRAIRGPRE